MPCADTSLYPIPILGAEMANHRQLRAMDREYVGPEARWRPQSGGLPVHEKIICGYDLRRNLRGKYAE
jgi:hypothetical protein